MRTHSIQCSLNNLSIRTRAKLRIYSQISFLDRPSFLLYSNKPNYNLYPIQYWNYSITEITLYYFNLNFKLKSILIRIENLNNRYNAKYILSILREYLSDYNIEDKILS